MTVIVDGSNGVNIASTTGVINLSGSTSGAITLAANAIAGTNTITFPANTGTAITTGSTAVVTQSMLSTGVSGNGPAFYSYSSGSYTAPAGANTLVSAGTKVFDTGTCYNNTASSTTLNGITAPAYSFTPNIAGYYQVNWCMQGSLASPNSSAYWLPFIYKNGSLYLFGTSYLYGGNGNTPSCGGSGLIYLNGTGDYIQLYLGTNNGGTWTASNQGTNYGNWFSAAMVRGA